MQPYIIFNDEIDSRSFRNARMDPREAIADSFGRAQVGTARRTYRHPRRYSRSIGPCPEASTWPDEGLATIPIGVLMEELVVERWEGEDLNEPITERFRDVYQRFMDDPAEHLRVQALAEELEAGGGLFREPVLVEGRALANGRYRLCAALLAGVPTIRVCVIAPDGSDPGYLLEDADYVTVVTFKIDGWSDALADDDLDLTAAVGIASIGNGDTWLKADIVMGAARRTVQAWVYASPEEVCAAIPQYLQRLEALGIDAFLLSVYMRELLTGEQLDALHGSLDEEDEA